jgi:drug/metabolite transporter (DMT)-like permease
MKRRLQADLALAFCSLIWGATFVVVKSALADSSVFVFNLLRFALAAAVMSVFCWRAMRSLRRNEIVAGLSMGFFLFAGYAFQTMGLKFTTPSKSAFITGSGVVLVPVLLAIFWGKRVNPWVWSGALAAVVGLYFLTVPSAGFSNLNVGDLLTLVCALMFAFFIIYVGRYSPHHSVATLSFVQVAAAALMMGICVPIFSLTGWEPARLAWTPNLIWAVLISAIGSTAIGFSLQVWAQRYASPTHTAILLSLEPVFAALTSILVVHERLGGRVLSGAALVFVGILLAELKGPGQTAVDTPAPISPDFGS